MGDLGDQGPKGKKRKSFHALQWDACCAFLILPLDMSIYVGDPGDDGTDGSPGINGRDGRPGPKGKQLNFSTKVIH